MSSSNASKGALLSSNSGEGKSQNSDISNSVVLDLLENRLKFEHSIDHNVVVFHVDSHKKRLKKLRKELNYIEESAWKYQSIDKILGICIVMSVVIVLTPNGRRQNVKITPNTTLLQVLEEVCSKHGFKPEDYDIRHHNKILDVSSIFRFTGLPNNALLEMTEVKKLRCESTVVLGLHLESGDRPTGEFVPSENLWNVILSLNPEAVSLPSPVIIYMRKEIHGKENLEKTTLRSLGLTGGRAVLRLFNRTPEELRTQARGSTELTRPAETKEKDTNSKVITEPSKENDSHPQSNLNNSPEKNKAKGEKDEKQKLSPSAEKVSEIPNKVEKLMESSEQKEEENIVTKDRDSSAKDSVVKDDNSKSVSEEPVNQPRYESASAGDDDAESRLVLLGDRNAVVYSLNKVKPKVAQEEPDDFFELTTSDARLFLRSAKQVCLELENIPLMTAAQREFEKNRRMLSLMNQYKHTVLRIKFPDRTVLQGTFSSVESIGEVELFVRNYLENPNMSFYLYTTPPKKILEYHQNLLEVDCVPSAIIYFGVPSESEKTKHFLRSDVMERFSSPSAAELTAYTSRGLLPKKKSEERKESESQIRVPDKKDIAPVPGPSTSQSSSEEKPEEEQETSPPFKVPKWFKIKK